MLDDMEIPPGAPSKKYLKKNGLCEDCIAEADKYYAGFGITNWREYDWSAFNDKYSPT